MLGTIDPFDFLLARDLGLTLSQVRGLPNHEITEWRAFYTYERAMQEFAQRKGGRGA